MNKVIFVLNFKIIIIIIRSTIRSVQPSIFVILPANTVFSQTWANVRELRRLRWNGVTLTYPWHLKASNNIQLIFDGPLKAKEAQSQGNLYATLDLRRRPKNL